MLPKPVLLLLIAAILCFNNALAQKQRRVKVVADRAMEVIAALPEVKPFCAKQLKNTCLSLCFQESLILPQNIIG